MRKNRYEKDVDNIVWTNLYQNEEHRNSLAWSLIAFGLPEFYRAHVIKNLGELELMVKANKARLIDTKQFGEFIQPFVWEKLADDFRMIVFFENYMKATLLFKQCIIHQLVLPDGAEQKRFNKFQRDIPVNVKSLAISNATEKNISKRTIGMDLLLSQSYQKVIRLPEKVLKHVKEMNASRNRLHLRSTVKFDMGPSIVDELKEVKAFADDWARQLRSAQFEAQMMNPAGWY